MQVITLDIEMAFTEALQYLLDGKCIGIRPHGNANYIVKYKPHWMNNESPDYGLCWSRSLTPDGQASNFIKSDQYLGKWSPVVIDSNDLPDEIKQLFILQDISSLKGSTYKL